jgi:transcriptional regulator with XRE-family HTH domain
MLTRHLLLLSQRLDYGMRLRAERTGETVSAADCARAAGVSPAAVSLWRKDENQISSTYARKLADYFGVDPVWLETGNGYPEREKNLRASLESERATADQLTTLIKHFYSATPYGRDQLLDAAASVEKIDDAAIIRGNPQPG